MLKDRSWLTENTEVLTSIGWIPIQSINRVGIKLMSYAPHGEQSREGLDKLVETPLLEFNIRPFNGKIPTRKSKHFMQGFLFFYKDCLFNIDKEKCEEHYVYFNRPYQGKLYNLITPTNLIIIRNIFQDKTNNDYNVIRCVK